MRLPALTAALGCALAATALAGDPHASPAGTIDAVRFDFEERRLGNLEDLPMHWEKVRGPGLPHYVNGTLADDRQRSGRWAFRLDLNGGSLAYRLPAGEVAARRGATYAVEAHVQTTALRHARAVLSAHLADGHGNPLSPVVYSAPHATGDGGEVDGKGWHRLSVDLPADWADPPPDAHAGDHSAPHPTADAWVVVELSLLQPDQLVAAGLDAPGDAGGFAQDVRGSAWFDDVSVRRLPRVAVTTGRPGNLFGPGDRVRLAAEVGGAGDDDLVARWTVADAAGETVYQRTDAVPRLAPGSAGGRPATVVPPELPAGWYAADLALTRGGEAVGAVRTPFAVVARDPRDRRSIDRRLGVIVPPGPPATWADVPTAAASLGVGRVRVDLGGGRPFDAGRLDRLLGELRDRGLSPTVALAGPLGGGIATLEELIGRHAPGVDGWQLGTGDGAADAPSPDALDATRRTFSRLLYGVPPAVAVVAGEGDPSVAPASAVLVIPPDVAPSRVPALVGEMRRAGRSTLAVALPADPAGGIDPAGLTKRLALALTAGADRVDVPLPFAPTGVPEGSRGAVAPTPAHAGVGTLLSVLHDATPAGALPVDDPTANGDATDADADDGLAVALLFDSAGTGVVVAWRDAGPASVELGTGPGVVAVTLDGRSRVLPGGPVDLSAEPVFLVGVNLSAAKLRAGVALDRPALESTLAAADRSGGVARRLTFANPTGAALNGSIRLTPPDGTAGWSASVEPSAVALSAGEGYDGAATIRLPYGTPAGDYALTAWLDLPDVSPVPLAVPVKVRVGLGEVGLRTTAARDAVGDLVVEQHITGYGERPADYVAYVAVPGRPRQDRPVERLEAGGEAVKSYRFRGVPPGTPILSGVVGGGGTRTLVDRAAAP